MIFPCKTFVVSMSISFILVCTIADSKADESEPLPESESSNDFKPIPKELATGKRIDVSDHQNIKLLPTAQDCGISIKETTSGTRVGFPIFLPRQTELSKFPWVVRLIIEDSKGTRTPGCAGTIIKSRYILTSATCLTALSRGSKVSNIIMGGYRTTCEGMRCTPMSKVFDVAEIIIHPDFVAPTRQHDIGLLHLKEDTSSDNFEIPLLCLPASENLFGQFKNNKSTVVGWSKYEEGKRNLASHVLYPRNLHSTEIRFEPRSYCDRFYRRSNAKFGAGRFCASGDLNKETCIDDEGGPVLKMVNIPEINQLRYIQIGIVSFQHKLCGRPGIPGGFTNVINYMPWILDNISQE